MKTIATSAHRGVGSPEMPRFRFTLRGGSASRASCKWTKVTNLADVVELVDTLS